MRANPCAMFELMECRVKRTVADPQHLTGHLLQTLADGPSIQGFQCQYFEDQHVQRPLDQVGGLTHKVSSRLPRVRLPSSPRVSKRSPKNGRMSPVFLRAPWLRKGRKDNNRGVNGLDKRPPPEILCSAKLIAMNELNRALGDISSIR